MSTLSIREPHHCLFTAPHCSSVIALPRPASRGEAQICHPPLVAAGLWPPHPNLSDKPHGIWTQPHSAAQYGVPCAQREPMPHTRGTARGISRENVALLSPSAHDAHARPPRFPVTRPADTESQITCRTNCRVQPPPAQFHLAPLPCCMNASCLRTRKIFKAKSFRSPAPGGHKLVCNPAPPSRGPRRRHFSRQGQKQASNNPSSVCLRLAHMETAFSATTSLCLCIVIPPGPRSHLSLTVFTHACVFPFEFLNGPDKCRVSNSSDQRQTFDQDSTVLQLAKGNLGPCAKRAAPQAKISTQRR